MYVYCSCKYVPSFLWFLQSVCHPTCERILWYWCKYCTVGRGLYILNLLINGFLLRTKQNWIFISNYSRVKNLIVYTQKILYNTYFIYNKEKHNDTIMIQCMHLIREVTNRQYHYYCYVFIYLLSSFTFGLTWVNKLTWADCLIKVYLIMYFLCGIF